MRNFNLCSFIYIYIPLYGILYIKIVGLKMFLQVHNRTCLRLVAAKVLKETYGFSVSSVIISRLGHLWKRQGKYFNEPEGFCANQMLTCVVAVFLKQNELALEVDITIPSLVHKTCLFLLKHVETKGLFRISGNQKRIAVLKQQLISGHELSDENPHDVANILKQLLRQNAVHIFPKCLNLLIHQALQSNASNKIYVVQLICLLLPTDHLHTLVYILQFLSRVAANENINKMSSSSLATILAPNLFELGKVVLKEPRSAMSKQEEFLKYLIDNSENIGVISPSVYEYFDIKDKSPKERWSIVMQTNDCLHHNKSDNPHEKSFFDRKLSSVRKKMVKSTPGKASDQNTKKRRLISNDGPRPLKRRSLQGHADVIISSSNTNISTQSRLTSAAPSLLITGRGMNIGSNQSEKNSDKVFYFSGAKKENEDKNKSTIDAEKSTTRSKRSSLFKKLLTPVTNRSLRKRRERRANIASMKALKKPLVPQNPNVSVVNESKLTKDFVKMEESVPIYHSDSLTITELSDTSFGDRIHQEKLHLTPPSPILPLHDLMREQDSFGAYLEEDSRVDKTGLGFSDPKSSSFDLLQEANSIDFLDSSQKQDEYFETKMDADLEEDKSPSCDFQKVSPAPSHLISRSSILSLENQTQFDCKNSAEPLSRRLCFIEDYKTSDETINEECKIVLDRILFQVSTKVACRVKPQPPIRCSSKFLPYFSSSSIVNDSKIMGKQYNVNNCSIFNAEKQLEFSTFLGQRNSVINVSQQNLKGTSGDSVVGIRSGKVLATVQHFNQLSSQSNRKKLSPLPYREGRDRKGSFKMGKPSGGKLKLDLPTNLELPSSYLSMKENIPLSGLAPPSFHFSDNNQDYPREKKRNFRHRKSRSLDSLSEETAAFRYDLLRSPSLSRLNPRSPLCSRSKKNCHFFNDFLDSSPAKLATPKLPRSRSPLLPMPPTTFL